MENARNSAVITAQTKCRPRSADCVSQHPSRNQPVIGSVEQLRNVPPRMFLEPSLDFMSSHQITNLHCGAGYFDILNISRRLRLGLYLQFRHLAMPPENPPAHKPPAPSTPGHNIGFDAKTVVMRFKVRCAPASNNSAFAASVYIRRFYCL